MIEKVERFHCRLCGYTTEHRTFIEEVRETGICPACNNGKVKCWAFKAKLKETKDAEKD